MPTIEIFLAIFIFILMVLISIEDIATGFLFLLVLVPLQHKELFSLVYWDVLPIRIAFFGLLLTTFYRFYLWFRRHKKKEVVLSFIKDPILVILVLLYIVRLISIIFIAENKISGFKLLIFYTTIVYFYILIKFLYQNYGFKFIQKSLWLYGLLGTVTGFISIVQFYSFKIFAYKFGAIWEIPGHNPRIGSTFWDVNHFGAFIISVIPLSIVFSIIYTSKVRVFWIFNSVFLIGVLYLTQSRSAWMGMAFAFIFFIYFLFIKGFKKYARYILIVSFVFITLFFSYFQIFKGSAYYEYKRFMHTRLDSFDTHFILLEGAMEVYRDNPILGAGFGNFNEAFRKTSYAQEYFFREKNIVNERVPSHSIWGEVASETGFFGISLYVLLFFVVLGFLVKGYLTSVKKESFLALGMASSIIALLVSGIFYTYNLEFFWFTIFFAVMIAFYLNKNINFSKYISWLYDLKKVPIIFLTLFSSFFLFWDLGKNKLIDWDEAIYAQVSRNILKSGDWFTLHWDLNKIWLEKPPLYMWFSAFFMNIFGISEFSARLTSAIFGLIGVVSLYFIGKYLFKSRLVGLVAGLILITSPKYLYYSRMGMLDVTVTVFIMFSVFYGYKYFDSRKFKNILLSGAFCGFAVMTKAIVGLLPIPILGLYGVYLIFIQNAKYKTLNTKFFIKSIVFFLLTVLLVALPWHLYMYFLHGDMFIKTYFQEHILNRGLTDQQGKTEPFLWYITVLKVNFRLWFLVLIPAFIYTVYKSYKKSNPHIFLVIGTLVIFLFFSVSNSKLVWYITPLYPILALINATFILFVLNLAYSKIGHFKKYSVLLFRGVFAIFFSLFLLLYFTDYNKLVYFPDFNRDLVKAIQEYNERYYEASSRVNVLYYIRLSAPVIKFYVEGDSTPQDREPFMQKIETADFSEPLIFVSRQGEPTYYQDIYGSDKIQKVYNEGAYYLTYVRSEEEYYNIIIQKLNAEVGQKINNLPTAKDKLDEVFEINQMYTEIYEYELILHKNLPSKYINPILLRYP